MDMPVRNIHLVDIPERNIHSFGTFKNKYLVGVDIPVQDIQSVNIPVDPISKDIAVQIFGRYGHSKTNIQSV